jgi:hypothetical protein
VTRVGRSSAANAVARHLLCVCRSYLGGDADIPALRGKQVAVGLIEKQHFEHGGTGLVPPVAQRS